MKIILLPITWKVQKENVIMGYIGTFLVGQIVSENGKHEISVMREGVPIYRGTIKFDSQSKKKTLEEAKQKVVEYLTNHLTNEYERITKFCQS